MNSPFAFAALVLAVLAVSAAGQDEPKDYLAVVSGSRDLNVFRAIVVADSVLSSTIPTLSDVHPVIPNDKAFTKFLGKLGNEDVDSLVSELKEDPTNATKADAVVEKAVPLFNAIEGAPNMTQVVLYHVLVGGANLTSRSGPQATALTGETLTVEVEDEDEHAGHDHGDDDDHDHSDRQLYVAARDKEDKDEEHLVIIDNDASRGNAHVVTTVSTGQGLASVIDGVLLPFNLTASGNTTSGEGGANNSESAANGDDDDGVCFPADAHVSLSDGTTVRMADLKAGDYVRNHHLDAVSSRVFLFSHRDSEAQVELVRVETASGHVVRATRNHYVHVAGKLRAFGAVKVGDVVHTVKGDSRVVKVSRVMGRGLYAPHAMRSDLVVDGVLVSSYSTSVHPRWAEAMLAPLRVVARLGVTEPLGGLLYNGADQLVGALPKGKAIN